MQRIEAEREVVGERKKLQSYGADINNVYGGGPDKGGSQLITAPATPNARQWQGWGTALKPALEPITVARKPLIGTVAQNVLEHGTGAINVDGCRVAGDMGPDRANGKPRRTDNTKFGKANETLNPQSPIGRWPANLILTYPEDEYKLKDNITPQQLAKLAEWMNENA